MAAESGNIIRFTYTGADGERIPDEATHVFVKARVIREGAFDEHNNIEEVICHEDVEKIEGNAFRGCRSLRRVIMPNVKIVEEGAFWYCHALEHVECDKLERVGERAFGCCGSLRNINLPSARMVQRGAFRSCSALTDVKFGRRMERIEGEAFDYCYNLYGIIIPLKDGLFTDDYIFKLYRVDLIEGELHETIAALHLDEWRNDMNEEIDSINNQVFPQRDRTVRRWIRSVLDKIVHYQAEHRRLLDDAATTLGRVFSQDIVMNNILHFLELPSYTFDEVENNDEDDNNDEE